MKTFADIRAAVDRGYAVHWLDDGYTVVKDKFAQYFVVCTKNDHAVGLYDPDYQPSDFYLKEAA